MWGDSFESRSYEPGSWLFSVVEALRKVFNVARAYVVTKVTRTTSKRGKRIITIETY